MDVIGLMAELLFERKLYDIFLCVFQIVMQVIVEFRLIH